MADLALIPYFRIPTLDLGALSLDAWAVCVCIAFIVGLEVSRARGLRLGLDVRDVVDGTVFTVGMGFVGGHLMHVGAYHPDTLDEKGWIELLRIWGGFSSTGGFLGAVVGGILFFKVLRPRSFWVHVDTIGYAFPFAWIFGRLGCFLSHDHIGRESSFPLAVDFPGGARHDLGLYEALWTAGIAALFFALRNRPFKPGLFLGLFAALYAPVRFGLDFLRNTDLDNADVRWSGLTPAQWVMFPLLAAGVWLVIRALRPGDRVTPGAPAPEAGPG